MAKKAKKKSAVSRAVRTVRRVLRPRRDDSKSREKGDAREEDQEEIFQALTKHCPRSEYDATTAGMRLSGVALTIAPTIPDWANDQHTLAGRKLGRGLDVARKAEAGTGAGR